MTVLRPYQSSGIDAARKLVAQKKKRILLVAPTGAGKCLALGTLVLMRDGTTKRVEDVEVGDLLMGPDSRPRTVLSTCRGEDEMFEIAPVTGEKWACNSVHVLTLVHSTTGEIVDIPLDEYLKMAKSWRHVWKQFAAAVEFDADERLPVDPYLRTGFAVNPLGRGEYAGFELDGDGRFLLGDFTVTHNTVIASAIIHGAVAKGSRTLFLAHRRELIVQTANKLNDLGVDHGIIMAGERLQPWHACQVASIQTLKNRRDVLRDIDLIFIDEAHHGAAATYQDALAMFPNATVLGLTATPWRQDGKGLADIFEEHVLVATPAELRDQGFLVPVGGGVYQSGDLDAMATRGGEFTAKAVAEYGDNPRIAGNVVDEYIKHAMGKRGIVFAPSVASSQAIAQMFREKGVPAEHIDGETHTKLRDAALARMRSGETLVICNCNVLTEGFDAPALEVCMLARPTLSLGLYLQMVGRVLRPSPGKTHALIHDHAGLLAMHGHPYLTRDYAPEETTSVNAAKKTTNMKPRTCEKCGSILAQSPCAVCGFAPSNAQLVMDINATRVTIDETKFAAPAKAEDKAKKKAALARKFEALSYEEKHAAFLRFVEKHGPKRAMRVYWWYSGETAWAPRSWLSNTGSSTT